MGTKKQPGAAASRKHRRPSRPRTKLARFESDARFRALVTASSDVLYRMSPDWTEMRQLGGGGFLPETRDPNTSWMELYIPPDAQAEVSAAIEKAVRTKTTFELEHMVRRSDGTLGWTFSRAVPILNSRGKIIEWFGAATDISTRKQAEEDLLQALAEKEILLREVHHRVKNNLEVIDSLLNLQARALQDSNVRDALLETSNRVHAIAEIHQILGRSSNFARVNMETFIENLSRKLTSIYVLVPGRVHTVILADPVDVDLQRAVALGLIVNELISNALKHAFPHDRAGTITVQLSGKGDAVVLRVADDGVGLPEQLPADSLGFKLVRILVEQLHGSLDFNSARGTQISVTFPG